MPINHSVVFFLALLWGCFSHAEGSLVEYCQEQLAKIPSPKEMEAVSNLCAEVKQLNDCQSEKKNPIFHFERTGTDKDGKKILALSLIHGDEGPSGEVTKSWIARLMRIEPRNSWRVIPIANPDGFANKARVNENGVDLNRNFPTKEWDEKALKEWRVNTKSDPRRFPGKKAVSENETKCILQHFEDFKPDFVISIHTPIGVLDFDGPAVKIPKFSPLPWSPLGNFPGSLGRYLWKDNNVPVLTIELKGNVGVKKLEELDRLQDISGTLAIEAKTRKNSVKK